MKIEQLKKKVAPFEQYLIAQCQHIQNEKLKNAILYSLSTGGKRIRPLFIFAILQSFGFPIESGYEVASAIEFIHTYSLIHDDLPAMDNDDYRRGQLTNHKKFGEATAILAGDALLTDAFYIILNSTLSDAIKCELALELSKSSGSLGMISGQMIDIESENKQITLDTLKNIHYLKTGELLRFCLFAGGKIAQVDQMTMDLLLQFAKHYGLAFQIHNDLLDIEQDKLLKKSTYVSILGNKKAKESLDKEVNTVKNIIQQLKKIHTQCDDELLYDFLNYVMI